VTKWVVDASVAAKWMLPTSGEDLVESAVELLDGYVGGDFDLIVPDLFWAECGSILWKAVRARRCSQEDAEKALDKVHAYGFATVSSAKLIHRAFSIAIKFDRTVYDSLYIALATEYRIQLVTADEKLVKAVESQCPVMWLGSL
jgi:predicted nucleic acid-binding protein